MQWALLAALLAATSIERRKSYDVCTVFLLACSLSFACALSLARVGVIRCNSSSYHTGTKISSSFRSLGLKRLLRTLTALQTTSSSPLDTWERSSYTERARTERDTARTERDTDTDTDTDTDRHRERESASERAKERENVLIHWRHSKQRALDVLILAYVYTSCIYILYVYYVYTNCIYLLYVFFII
jgi:hypothetical protein